MKKGFRIVAAAVALAAALAIVGCNNASNSAAVGGTSWASGGYTITFLDGGTIRVVQSTQTVAEGTFTGDTTKDGNVSISLTRVKNNSGNWETLDPPQTGTATISGNEITVPSAFTGYTGGVTKMTKQ